MGYSFWLASSDLLNAPFHKYDSTYHDFCYTGCEALADTDSIINIICYY